MATAWQDWPEDRREALRAWLRANNINPSDVPIDADLYIAAGPGGTAHIHYEAFHLNSSGQKHLNERGNEVAVEKRSIPLLVAPPAWWEPHIKPTRDQLLDAVERTRALHRRHETYAVCEHCSEPGNPTYVPWPCPTLEALNTEVQP
ncbi:hypothetical protein [Streptomyces sp. NPDC003395]